VEKCPCFALVLHWSPADLLRYQPRFQ
jgi:hypothetical protein